MPTDVTFPLWAASLNIDFPDDNIPILENPHKWGLWADAVAQEGSFNVNGVPGAHGFHEPMEWAMVVYNLMSNSG